MSSFNYSVVIPFGKVEGNFIRCIKSTIEQAIQPTNVFVVCNGEVTEDYIKKLICDVELLNGKFISFVYPERCTNANIARNFGLDLVKSDWVAFLDSDDWWDNDWVTNVKNAIKDENPDFLYGSLRVHGAKNRKFELICNHYQEQFTPENYLLAYRPAQTSSYFIKTELAKFARWDNNIRRHQDYDFFVRLVKITPKVLAIHNVSVNVDWTGPRRHKYHEDCLKVVDNWAECVEKKFYIRHLNNLRKSSFKSCDWNAYFKLSIKLINAMFNKKYLK